MKHQRVILVSPYGQLNSATRALFSIRDYQKYEETSLVSLLYRFLGYARNWDSHSYHSAASRRTLLALLSPRSVQGRLRTYPSWPSGCYLSACCIFRVSNSWSALRQIWPQACFIYFHSWHIGFL